jgi:hypothetical protein
MRPGAPAHSLRNLLALVMACSAMLAVSAQTSVADPVTGVLGAVGATATQQLDAVAHGATAIPLPAAAPPAVAQVAANAAQGVDAVPQAAAGAGDVVRSNASSFAESSRAGDPEGGSGSSEARQSSPPSSPIALATRAGRVLASPTPARGEHAPIVTAAHRIVSSRIDRVTGTLAYAAQRAPAARSLPGRASRVAGALLAAVANVAAGARDTFAAIPVPVPVPIPVVASLPRATGPSDPFTLFPAVAGAGAGTSVAQPSIDPTALATSLASIGSVQAEPSSAAALGAQPVQQLATDREASADARGGMRGPRETTSLATSATPASTTSPANAPASASPAQSQSVPAPAPGGFSPASSASVAGGVSAATFLALGALLLLAAPRALRRLQRAGTSWRLAQFSLIPARPG